MKIGIIGFGNLGRALAEGLIQSGSAGTGDIYVCEKSDETRELSEKTFGVSASADINYVIKNADIIFLTVKGFVFEELSANIAAGSLSGKIIVSFMAGVQLDTLRSLANEAVLVRAMPSLAIASCDGVIGYTKAPAEVEKILHKLGYAFETEPENIEKVMAFSSCGLGFAAYLIDAFSAAGESMGFPPETCSRIAALTFKNAIDRGGFKDTVRAVATPGGATEQGILYMEAQNLPCIVSDAVKKAYDKMK